MQDPERDTPPRSDPSSDDSLAESFWAVARRLRHTSMQSLAPRGILPSHHRALRVLLRHGTMRLSELSDHLHIAPRSATEVVDALEARGLVVRAPDPHDRRATLVALTDEGTRMGDAIRKERSDDAERLFGALTTSDRDHLARILRFLRD